MKIRVKPIYGWGWHAEDESHSMTAVKVPPEFDLDIEINEQPHSGLGLVTESNHPLTGMWISLQSRGMGYNLAAFLENPNIKKDKPRITGYADVTPDI